jgi:hypothetical protein
MYPGPPDIIVSRVSVTLYPGVLWCGQPDRHRDPLGPLVGGLDIRTEELENHCFFMNVGVMQNYKLRDLRASHTLCCLL